MPSSTALQELIGELAQQARALGLTDSAWAARAGMPKETLSRLRRRSSCDFVSLAALAEAVGARVGIRDVRDPQATPDGHFVSTIDRGYEERLAALCASRDLDPKRWGACGPAFFMAGLAVMLASSSGFHRRGLLALAEQLHPGASEPAVFAHWLESSPIQPSRFLPLVSARASRAA